MRKDLPQHSSDQLVIDHPINSHFIKPNPQTARSKEKLRNQAETEMSKERTISRRERSEAIVPWTLNGVEGKLQKYKPMKEHWNTENPHRDQMKQVNW